MLVAIRIPGIDHRLGWSDVPASVVLLSNAIVLAGYVLSLAVLRENRYASRVVEVVADQTLVSTGPYARVRHPMYSAILIMMPFSATALGSWWALPALLPLPALLVLRIHGEERLLRQELPGYVEYSEAVPFRLVPGLW